MSTSHESFSFTLEGNRVPIAVILPGEIEAVVGSIVKLDGRASQDPEGNGLTYTWTFSQIPIGSQVELAGFTNLESDSSVVSFAPDIIGTYKVQLVVSDGSLTSDPAESTIDVRVILVPYHQGIIPDASFIWNYLSDFWALVDGRKKFETFWSGAIQIVASELLKLYQYDYAKSIRDVQDVIQKRWLHYSPGLKLDKSKTSFILANDLAGVSAATFVYDSDSGLPLEEQPEFSNAITVPLTEGGFTTTSFNKATKEGRLLKIGQRSFTMKRSQTVRLSEAYGTDGASSGADSFAGSFFTVGMEGATLRILSHAGSPSIVGDFVIDTVVDTENLTVVVPPGTTWAAHSDIEYTVLPAEGMHSTFFADQGSVPTAMENQAWRFSSTLVSSELNFEELGVSPGDVVEVEVTRIGANLVSNFFCQVVSVDRNRLGFVLNLEDLVEGTSAGWMTSDIQVLLASDLQVKGLSAASDGSLVYAGDSAAIKTVLSSLKFRRSYFETVLTPDSEIPVGPFSIKAAPLRVIRNKKIAVDPKVVSVPILQEYVKQPQIARDGDTLYFVFDNSKIEMAREPHLLSENLDYVIDDEATITGTCVVISGNDEVTIPLGDLFDRSVQEQDTITIELGTTKTTFDIRRVVASDKIRVFPVPSSSSSSARFTLTRRVPGTFIRFIDGTFSKTSPAPTRLWAEVTYFDNNDTIENNFGVMVGVLREDLEKAGAVIPYKSSVAGLMYALARGPTVANLELSAHILLGLPFTQTAGVIREINPSYRIREDGSPRYGRILIDSRNSKGEPTGITYLYLYPQGRQIDDPSNPGSWIPAVPDFSGLAINPDTEEEYAVGDTVKRFTPLSKGVEIEEYLTNADWAARLVAQGNSAINLQKYHSFNLIVNSDLVTSADVDLMAQFIKRAKAHYTRLSVGLLRSLEDFIEIEDQFTFGRYVNFFDVPSSGITAPPMLGISDENQTHLSLDGVMYTRLLSGTDLVTTQGSTTVSSAAGAFMDARGLLLEEWDSPLLRDGDLLSIDGGSNQGKYVIGSVGSDTTLFLASFVGDFETLTDQEFTIFRPIQNPIWRGACTVTNGDPTISLSSSSIGAGGVSVGDKFVFFNDHPGVVSNVYTIIAVAPDAVFPEIEVTPAPSEASASYFGWVIRDSLMTGGVVIPYGSTQEFYADTNAGDGIIQFTDGPGTTSWGNVALIKTGDLVEIAGVTHEILWLDRATNQAYVTPAPAGTVLAAQIYVTLRPNRPSTPISVSFLDRVPEDYLELDLISSPTVGDDVSTTATLDTVSLTVETFANLNAVPGDFLLILEGPDSSVDVGYGDGVYPIVEVSGANATLMFQLSSTGTYQYGIRRRVSP